MRSKVSLGVIGAGNFASMTLLPAIKAAGGITLGGICSLGGTSARSAALRYGFRFCASDPSELLRDTSINTIAICTRHSEHANLVVSALEAGKHVFCEKPLAVNEEQLAAVVEAFDHHGGSLQLTVGYNRRYSPLAKQLKEFLVGIRGPLLMHYRVNAGFIPPDHWINDMEQGGGRILGEVCHFVDFLSYVCGYPVASASASCMANVGRYSNDNLVATLRFSDNSIGTISYCANGDKSFSKERLEVFAEERVAVLEDFQSLHTVLGGKAHTRKLRLRADKGHRGEWEAFAQAIDSSGPLPIPMSDLVNSTLTTFALVRSASDNSLIQIDTNRSLSLDRNHPPPRPLT